MSAASEHRHRGGALVLVGGADHTLPARHMLEAKVPAPTNRMGWSQAWSKAPLLGQVRFEWARGMVWGEELPGRAEGPRAVGACVPGPAQRRRGREE